MPEESKYWRILTRKLLEEHRSICYQYGVKLRAPLIELTDVSSYWGKWRADHGTISLSRKLLLDHSWDIVLNVLKHEMAHQLVTEELGNAPGHGKDFKKACESLGVPPGFRNSYGPDPVNPPNNLDRNLKYGETGRKLEKIRKLLALSESANEHEAFSAMAKARRMLEKYNLEEDWQGKTDQTAFTNLLINLKRKRVECYHRAICSLLIDHFKVQIVITPLFDARELTSYKCIDILGRADNVRIAEHVYHFLMDRLTSLWRKQRKSGSFPRNGRNSYWLGVLNGFRERLADSSLPKSRPEVEAPKNRLPAIAEKAALKRFIGERYPRLRNSRKRTVGVDPGNYEAGCREGRKLKLRKGLNEDGGRRMLPEAN